MARKSEYVITLVTRGAAEIVYPEAVIAALKEFKKNHKYSMLPDGMQARQDAMAALTTAFCAALGIEPIAFRAFDLTSDGNSSESYYDSIERCITMLGKLSVITFLHEFAHGLNPEGGEDFARMWSLTLFRKVYPKAFENLFMATKTPTEFFLVRPTPQSGTEAFRLAMNPIAPEQA
jgi:hypothetical protein